MKDSFKIGLGFGLTSGVITTLGLMMGLKSFTESKLIIIGGILTIAIADALSDSVGIHVAQESDRGTTRKDVWESTLSSFFSKFLTTSTFIAPIALFSLKTAISINILWGISLLGTISYIIAKAQNKNPFWMVTEHLGIAIFVIISSSYLQVFVERVFM